MEYKHNFNEICQQVPFSVLFQLTNTDFTREGKTLKTEEIIVTEQIAKINGYVFDLFKWKGKAGGGSVLDYCLVKFNLKTKLRAAEYLKAHILGEKEQKEEIPELKLDYCEFLAEAGIDEEIAKQYEVGQAKGKSVMSGRVCFKLYDEYQKHRGYIGLDHTNTKKVKWYVPNGTKTSNMLYNYNRRNGNEYCILTDNALSTLYLCTLGFPYTVGLLTASLTAEQLNLMKVFKRVMIICPNAQTLVKDLSKVCFVKTIDTEVLGKTYDEIRQMF